MRLLRESQDEQVYYTRNLIDIKSSTIFDGNRLFTSMPSGRTR